MKGVLPILRKESGCDYHRVYLPMKYLGYDFSDFEKNPGIKTFEGVEILFFNRIPIDPIEKVIEYKRKYGFKIVIDLDDWWELDHKHLLYSNFQKSHFADMVIKGIKAADAITCTTDRLASKIKVYNKNVHIIPNALPFGDDQFHDKRSLSPYTRFMYAGGSTHFWDVRTLINPFKRLNNDGLNAQFILAGYNSSSEEVWNKIENAFSLNGTLKGYERRYSLSIDDYMDHYMFADVSLVPLESNIFTPYKSNLKVIEAGCKCIPVIVSDIPPYSDEPNKGVLMTAKNTREWVDHIRYCARNPNFVKEKGEELGEYVRKKYDLRQVNIYREHLFTHLKNT